ncbi:MAG: SAM-dependent methyltransferase [Thermodesulfovibrionales bacterium]|nr:SAM-dependent methyltransferase [Thermodesulfovibrionales bacterium]
MNLKDKVLHKIKKEGSINFELFMEMALYDHEYGYYMREDIVIGKYGDFYTSPHLHPIFGAMIGKQIEEFMVWVKKNPFTIVEIGAGMGYLTKDLLDYLHKKDKLNKIRYYLVEINPHLRKQQTQLLKNYDFIEWVSSLDELTPFIGCVISNELLDSFPVRVIEVEDKVYEIFISLKDKKFTELKVPASQEVLDYLDEFNINLLPFQPYRTEVNLKIKEWLKKVSKKLQEGFILTIDYGYCTDEYYCEERNKGTLLSYFKHQVSEDIYSNIGQQDITAHVNFSSLHKWGKESKLKTLGFTSQGAYLISLGIDEMIEEIYGNSPDVFELAKIKGLILPQGMGESHKVIIQYKGELNPDLKGFALRNQIKKLNIK